MKKRDLELCLDQGMSLDQIASRYGKHASTISYWLRKFDLKPNGAERHAPRGALDRALLDELVRHGLPLREIADTLDRSMTTVRYWIDRYRLEAPRTHRRAVVERAIAEGRRTLLRECPKHGVTTFVLENSGRTRCRKCRMDAVSKWRRRTKAKLVGEAGGRCVSCGYDRYQGALQFHHLDPAQKRFHLADSGVTQ